MVADNRSRREQLSEVRHHSPYGRLSLLKRIELEKRSLYHYIVNAVASKKRKPTDVLFELGLFCLPYLCRRVDSHVKRQRGAMAIGKLLPNQHDTTQAFSKVKE